MVVWIIGSHIVEEGVVVVVRFGEILYWTGQALGTFQLKSSTCVRPRDFTFDELSGVGISVPFLICISLFSGHCFGYDQGSHDCQGWCVQGLPDRRLSSRGQAGRGVREEGAQTEGRLVVTGVMVSSTHVVWNTLSPSIDRLGPPACCCTLMPKVKPWWKDLWSAGRPAAVRMTTRRRSRSASTCTTKPPSRWLLSMRDAALSGRWACGGILGLLKGKVGGISLRYQSLLGPSDLSIIKQPMSDTPWESYQLWITKLFKVILGWIIAAMWGKI